MTTRRLFYFWRIAAAVLVAAAYVVSLSVAGDLVQATSVLKLTYALWGYEETFLDYMRTYVILYVPGAALAGYVLGRLIGRAYILYGVIGAVLCLGVMEIYHYHHYMITAHVITGEESLVWLLKLTYTSPQDIALRLVALTLLPLFGWLWSRKRPSSNNPLEEDAEGASQLGR